MLKDPKAAAKERESEPLAAQVWRQPPQMLTTALIVAGVAVAVAVAGIAVTVAAALIPVEAFAGAAAGASVTILRSLWETQAVSKAFATAVSAVTGGLAGRAVAVLALLIGVETQRGSAVAAAVTGAAIVLAVGAQLQWVVDKLQWIIPLVKKIIAFLKTIMSLFKVALTGALVVVAAKISGAAIQAGSAALKGATQAGSAALKGATQAGSAASKGATQAGSAATKGATQAGSVASKGATQAGSAATKGATQAGSAASKGATQAGSAASKGATQAESAATKGATQAGSATSGGATQASKMGMAASQTVAGAASQTVAGAALPAVAGAALPAVAGAALPAVAGAALPAVAGAALPAVAGVALPAVVVGGVVGGVVGFVAGRTGGAQAATKANRCPQTMDSPHKNTSQNKEETPQTDKSPQREESPQTGESNQTDKSNQTGKSPQTGESPQAGESPQIEESPETDKSPQSDKSLQTGESPKTDESPQSGKSPQTSESPQKGESPQTDKSPQTGESPQKDKSKQSDKSPQISESPQTGESPQIGESPQTDQSPQTDKSPQTGESPKKEESQTGESPQRGESPQTGESPVTDQSPQSDKSPQTGESPKTDESPQSDESPQLDESPQTGRSPQTEKSPQSDESPQTGESPQKEESPQTDKSPQTDLIGNTKDMITKARGSTENRMPDPMTEDSKADDEAKDSRTAGVKTDQHSEQKEKTFKRLNLQGISNNKLKAADVLQITAHSLQSHESCAEEELANSFLQKLLMLNYRARYIKTKETNKQHHTQQIDNNLSENEGDLFDEMFLSDEVITTPDSIHLMDVQMAVFHCADSFLKQQIVTKLSQCQFALPLLVPDPFTQQIQFPLWTFRQINKSWKMKNTNNEIISKVQPVCKAETPMVSFFRFGSVSSSKSQLMNNLINEKHNTFFHRNCPGSSKTRVLMDGVVEIAWYCPSAKDTDKFTDCVAFCNLHGDAGANEKQLQILTDMSSVNVLLLSQLNKSDKNTKQIQTLYSDKKPLICLLTENDSVSCKKKKGKYTIGLKDRNQSDVSEELRIAINDCLLSSASASMFRLEDVSKHSDIRVDEEDDKDCKRGKEAANRMVSLLKNKRLKEIKESFLPCQGKLWHLWCQKNKEINRPQGNETEQQISTKLTEMNKIREKQDKSHVSEFINLFIKQINSHGANKMFFLTWLRILLDEFTTADLSALHHKYNEKWSTVLKLKGNNDQPEKDAQTELEKISKELQAATFGVEHIMREIAQIYESRSSVKKNKQFDFSYLPSLAAEMMISGFPLELMDGDAAHVPLIWVTAVLDQLIQKLGDQRVFVLSVLGIQSSGKSTMLNVMFGLQFAVSAGRCTRGAFMQLLRVSEEIKQQLKFDYILVVDTEGLRALELAGRSTRHHDNELATFVVGLGNLTLINIFGENPSEMQDILQIVVQAFLRMKQVNLKPSCMFVHQNVSDITAGEKNMEGRRRLQRTLDDMTKLAAKEEDRAEELFSDVINFDVSNDVKYFAQLWEGSPPMAPPNPNYCENIQELKETIIAQASKSNGMMLTHLRERIQDLWKALLNERFVFSFRNSLEISVYRRLETEYSKWTWSLRSAMMEIENRQQNKIENETVDEIEETKLKRELKAKIEEVKKSMSEFFEKDTEADILIQWKSSFEIKITDLQENIVKETKRKLNDILQQRHLKREIDDQRTQHENTLLEKSKELALTLRDKAKDEETLKRVFDLFWKEWVEKIKKIAIDTQSTTDIDILRDVEYLLSDIYKSAPIDTRKDIGDIFTVKSYSDYVQLRKSSGITGPVKNWVNEKLGYSLSKDDEANIRTLITDVSLQTDNMILSFKISKLGYNNSCIQHLMGYIKARIIAHEQSVKYVFKNDFFVDLVFSIFKRVNKTFTDQHRLFKETNDPLLYLEKKRGEYYKIFQNFCQGATSTAIFGEIICQKLKEPIEQSVYKHTTRRVADEIKSNCPSLNGNRSNLEKHILKNLAEEENFDKYINYILNPRDHFKSFIRDEVHQYIRDKFSVSVQPKMKQNIEVLERKILSAADESTKHVQMKSGDIDLWLKFFTQKLSDDLIFSVKDFSGMTHDDVNDFNLLEDVIRKELLSIMSNINKEFNTHTFSVKLDLNNRPDEILIDHFCQCCWSQCPFCAAICTNTIENHEGDHSVPFHRVDGLRGWYFDETKDLSVEFCTTLVTSDNDFYESDQLFPYTEYRKAGGDYAKWSITPDLSELPYWKWCICRFQKELESHYERKFQGDGRIPDEWRKYTKQDAIESLNNAYK